MVLNGPKISDAFFYIFYRKDTHKGVGEEKEGNLMYTLKRLQKLDHKNAKKELKNRGPLRDFLPTLGNPLKRIFK